MSLAGQHLDPTRYTLVPRTLSFLVRGEEVLLLRVGAGRGEWAGKLNGIGGHLEQGEDPLNSARREIREEAGFIPVGLRLCGVIVIDLGTKPGIGLYVYVGEPAPGALPHSGPEGSTAWFPVSEIGQLPLVEDLFQVLPRALTCHRNATTFSALYQYDSEGRLRIQYAD